MMRDTEEWKRRASRSDRGDRTAEPREKAPLSLHGRRCFTTGSWRGEQCKGRRRLQWNQGLPWLRKQEEPKKKTTAEKE